MQLLPVPHKYQLRVKWDYHHHSKYENITKKGNYCTEKSCLCKCMYIHDSGREKLGEKDIVCHKCDI